RGQKKIHVLLAQAMKRTDLLAQKHSPIFSQQLRGEQKGESSVAHPVESPGRRRLGAPRQEACDHDIGVDDRGRILHRRRAARVSSTAMRSDSASLSDARARAFATSFSALRALLMP